MLRTLRFYSNTFLRQLFTLEHYVASNSREEQNDFMVQSTDAEHEKSIIDPIKKFSNFFRYAGP